MSGIIQTFDLYFAIGNSQYEGNNLQQDLVAKENGQCDTATL